MAKKRITELATETTLKDGQYVAIDHTTDGTKKLNLGAELTDLKEDLNEIASIRKNDSVGISNLFARPSVSPAVSVTSSPSAVRTRFAVQFFGVIAA